MANDETKPRKRKRKRITLGGKPSTPVPGGSELFGPAAAGVKAAEALGAEGTLSAAKALAASAIPGGSLAEAAAEAVARGIIGDVRAPAESAIKPKGRKGTDARRIPFESHKPPVGSTRYSEEEFHRRYMLISQSHAHSKIKDPKMRVIVARRRELMEQAKEDARSARRGAPGRMADWDEIAFQVELQVREEFKETYKKWRKRLLAQMGYSPTEIEQDLHSQGAMLLAGRAPSPVTSYAIPCFHPSMAEILTEKGRQTRRSGSHQIDEATAGQKGGKSGPRPRATTGHGPSSG